MRTPTPSTAAVETAAVSREGRFLRGPSDHANFFALCPIDGSPAVGRRLLRGRGGVRLERDRASVRGQDVTELVQVVRPADVFSDTHTVQGGRLFRKVPLGDDHDRGWPRDDRGRPEQAIELVVVATVTSEMNDNEPGRADFRSVVASSSEGVTTNRPCWPSWSRSLSRSISRKVESPVTVRIGVADMCI